MSANGLHPESSVPSHGAELAANLPTGNRAPPRRRVHFSLLAALAVGFALLATPTVAHAYKCKSAGVVVIFLCRDGDCTEGFQVEGRRIRNALCKTRPEVHDLSSQHRVRIREIIERSDGTVPDGIYQLGPRPSCMELRWQNRSCSEAPSITKLNDAGDARTLAHYRNEWLTRERKGLGEAAILYWRMPILFSLLTLFSLGWPWVLVTLKQSLEKYTFYISLAAIPLQAAAFWLISLYELFFVGGEPLELLRFAQVCAALIPLFVTLQFGYLIWRKLKPAAR